ncbi:MAG TPA: exodeoxyribonuclease III [Anaerolineales bacterium]|nr:exodeoxyribonuclease III [Anaerolineales bacterium]
MTETKITTWNVNGLRAVLAKGSLTWLENFQPDVLCLQEIKARPEQIDPGALAPLSPYQAYWNPADKPGYSGVATFTRQEPLSVESGWGNEEYDREGRVILTQFPDFKLLNIYFPNGQRDHGRLQYKLAFYEELLGLCVAAHERDEKIIICGDFNTAHNEIDLRNPKSNVTTSGFMPEERAWLDRYVESRLVDAFRVLYPDKVQYTWWTYISNARARNVGWRLDFFMVSDSLMARVKDVIIHDDVYGSDHCPVTLVLDF